MPVSLPAGPIEARTKGEVRRLRRSGYVPISIQHRGQETVHLQGPSKELDEFIRAHGESALMDLVVAPSDSKESVLLKHVHRHPITRRLLQVTFQRVRLDEPIKAFVAILLHGEPEPVRLHTAIVQHQMERIEVRCLPTDLPDHITAEIAHLGFGDSVRVSDLPVPGGVEVLTPESAVIASLASLAAHAGEEEEAPAEEAAVAPAEGAVEGAAEE